MTCHLRSKLNLDLSGSKVCFDASQQEKYDGFRIIFVTFFVQAFVYEKTIWLFVIVDMTSEVTSGTKVLKFIALAFFHHEQHAHFSAMIAG